MRAAGTDGARVAARLDATLSRHQTLHVAAIRILRALLLAASGGVVTLAQLNLPAGLWVRHQGVLWVSAAVLAAIVLADASGEANYLLKARQIREYDRNLRSILSSGLGRAMTVCGADWDQLEVRYYRKRGLLARRLGLVAAIKAGADLRDAHRVVKSGVGLAGTAFKTQEVVAQAWADYVHEATEAGRAAWEQRPESERFGMMWGELQYSPRHEGVIANPIFSSSGAPVGCILLSGALKLSDLRSEGIERILEGMATSLDLLGEPPRGWWRAHGR